MAAPLNELRQRRIEAAKAHVALVEATAATAEKDGDRAFTDPEKKATAESEGKIKALDERIAALEAARDLEMAHAGEDLPAPTPALAAVAGKVPVAPMIRTGERKTWTRPAEQFKAIRQHAINQGGGGVSDPRLFAAASGANESIDSEGAFLVQQDWGGTLAQMTFDTGILARKVRRQSISNSSNGIKFNLLDETSRADGSRFGGIQAYWAAEADSATASKPKIRRVESRLQKLLGLLYVTDEMLEDAAFFESYVNDWFPREFGFKIDDAIYRGSGSGQPLGILNSPAKIKISAETGQATKTINATNIEKMYAAMLPFSLRTAEWFLNIETAPQLFTLYHAIGTGGVPVFIPGGGMGNGLEQAPFGTLLGRPINYIEQASGLGTEGDICFFDPQMYLLLDKGPIEVAASIHVKFLTDESAFRWSLRLDGLPLLATALTPYKAAVQTTISPYITLAAR